MQPQIEKLKNHIREAARDESFVHHKWFVEWHLELVERLALELCEHYPQANKDLVTVMVWMHDYGKIVDFNNQDLMVSLAGREKLIELGIPSEITGPAIANIELINKKTTVDLRTASIEVQIVSSADGCSHMVGPYYKVFWNDVFDATFVGRTIEQRQEWDLAKIEEDWSHRIVLPEARVIFQKYCEVIAVQAGKFPDKFFA
jgi:hypothetical protein